MIAGKSHEESTCCIVIDYAQNAGLPQFGESQAGPSYYWSPITIDIFGIVNAGEKGGELDAYVYHEGQGKKGGNNVASMVMLYLKKKGWLNWQKTGKELNILLDNCGGQNKNNFVLWLANLLVECKFFKTVNFIFYVKGHTKISVIVFSTC